MFEKYTKEAGKEQYLIPYFIAAHPGTKDEDMTMPANMATMAHATALPFSWSMATAM